MRRMTRLPFSPRLKTATLFLSLVAGVALAGHPLPPSAQTPHFSCETCAGDPVHERIV